MTLITKLLSSQKFIAMLSGVVGLVILKVFKVEVDSATLLQIVGLVAAYILGQGIADAGKGAAKVEAITSLTANQNVSAHETTKAIDKIASV